MRSCGARACPGTWKSFHQDFLLRLSDPTWEASGCRASGQSSRSDHSWPGGHKETQKSRFRGGLYRQPFCFTDLQITVAHRQQS